MKIALAVVVTILLSVTFELLYEWAVAARTKRKDSQQPETMEQSMNDGCQLSIRMLVFGVVSGAIVWSMLRL